MNRRAADGRPGPPGEPAVQVQVTVIRGPGRPTPWQRIAGMSGVRPVWPVACLVVLARAIAPCGPTAGPSGRRAPATAYAYPLRCVSVAIALHDPRFAREAFDRTIPSCAPRNGEWLWLDHDARPQ